MKTLILSCNTGEGHNSCAKAIKEYFELNGEPCDIADSLAFASKKMSQFISGWHVRLYRHLPAAFGMGYGFMERHPSYLEEGSAAYRLLTIGTDRLYQFIVANGYDTVICTHVFAALLVTEMKEKYPCKIKTALVHTDYTCFPGTAASDMDVYFIPHTSLIPLFVGVGISREKLIPAGIPVRQAFFAALPKEEAKRSLGVDPNRNHVVIMSGSMGCGPIEETAEILAEMLGDENEITLVCGTNHRAKERVEKSIGDRENVHILGYFKDISRLLDSADLVFTKPGGISTSEIAKKALPMVLIQAVEGCETHNYRFFTNQGVALLSHDPQELAEMGAGLLKAKGKLEEMAAFYTEELRCNGAEIVFKKIKELSAK